eukprot:CAMPEP_0194260162 /NCGR_PEP_ID=MMETSP0158-20130606/45307_1 /TAXON_ID=33649 /ORGANISM="Thalassionema nitzschioides, Strain L26-B" /LENGTH=235 /DNA_ID=CAMNT_0039000231 /DNA_START=275 /DNA_END=982 /DNA_ORIENTATION=-
MAGSCHGGSATGAFEYIKHVAGFVPYETCQTYIACSSDSDQGFCPFVDTGCVPENICRTCTSDGTCTALTKFPNASIAEYGVYDATEDLSLLLHKIKSEIYARGPVKTSLNAEPLVAYKGGIIRDSPHLRNLTHNHGVSIVGWGGHSDGVEYWIVRNSWGEYWGEMGFFKVEMGFNLLGMEHEIAWVTPKTFSTSNIPCGEDGSNCQKNDGYSFTTYVDPSEQFMDRFAMESRAS